MNGKTKLLCTLLVLSAASLFAATPSVINYQGRLTNAIGTVVPDGNYSVSFTIYDAAVGGTVKWTETQSVTTSAGLFAVLLGALSPVTDSVFNNPNRYLGIKVGLDPELSPRIRLVTAPYSYRVNTVDGAAGGQITTNLGINADTATGIGLRVQSNGDYAGYFTTPYLSSTARVIYAQYQGVGSADAVGIEGVSTPSDFWGIGGRFTGGYVGLEGLANPTGGKTYYGVQGKTIGGTGRDYGVYGYAQSANSAFGVAADAYGVEEAVGLSASASLNGSYPGPSCVGVQALAHGPGGATGIYGSSDDATSTNFGVMGSAISTTTGKNYGVYGSAGGAAIANYAGYFDGDVHVAGTFSCPVKLFRIDDPLDPAARTLQHACVESNEYKNVYDGVVTTDVDGGATVTLPNWFEALNKDFRYQLTIIGQFAQAYVASEISNNQFVIKSDKPNVKVSWQVTGVRRDPYVLAHPLQVETDKPAELSGKYLNPVEYGVSEELGVDYSQRKHAEHLQRAMISSSEKTGVRAPSGK